MDVWAIGIGGVGTVTGLAGVLLAYLANQHAQKANSVAERALAESARANGIAVDANKLAEDANAVSERALRISGEKFEYAWRFRVENDGLIVLSHCNANEARDLTLIAEVERSGKPVFPEARARLVRDHVAFGEELSFPVESIYPELISKARAEPKKVLIMTENSTSYSGRHPIKFDVMVSLAWQTPGGSKCNRSINQTLSCREDDRGNIVFTAIE